MVAAQETVIARGLTWGDWVLAGSVFAGGIFKLSPENLAIWLRDPPGEKPGSIMPNLHLTEDEIAKLVAYLETLK